MIEAIGALLGGVFRLAPEVMAHLDKKNERKHELSMLDRTMALEELKGKQQLAVMDGQQELAEIQGTLAGVMESLKGQFTRTGMSFVDAATWLVRPLTTYLLLLLYMGAKIAGLMLAADETTWLQAIVVAYDGEDRALLSGILSYWFISRTIEKQKGARGS